MPLTPPVTPAFVESVGALTPDLFQLPDQTSLNTLVQSAIDYADAWMAGHMGSNYNLTQFTWQVNLQQRAQAYLALEALSDTLKARKIYGTHGPYMSEDSPAYAELINAEWGERALASLDLWVTVERAGRGFALPLFLTSAPIPETDDSNNGLDPLTVLYSELLDRARGISLADVGTVRR